MNQPLATVGLAVASADLGLSVGTRTSLVLNG